MLTAREELTILQLAVQKAIANRFLHREDEDVAGVDYTFEPPSIAVRFQSRHGHLADPVYLDILFPLWEIDWAKAFWGTSLIGDHYYGLLPAWKYHQHKLLEFWQNKEREEFFKYIEVFL